MVTVDIDLEPGWNLFSFNVIPVLPDVDYVLASIHGQYSVVEGFNGTTVSYYPDQLPELNTLKTLDAYHGYWIKMEQAATLSITGTLVTSAVPLNLDEGWNLVSYLADSALPVSTALSSIDGLYTAVLGYDGQGLSFYTSLPLEMNTLSVLSPGHGYWIKMSTAATLFYSSD